MMETIIIVAPVDVMIDKFINIVPDSYKKEKQSDSSYLISSETSHCWIEYDEEIESFYDEDEMKIVKMYIQNPKYFTCEFSDIDFGKEMLSIIIFDDKLVIDNDHGDIMTGGDFKRKLRDEPDWDWRI
jgi:hypothetical protein